MKLDEAIELLKDVVRPSTSALDNHKRIELTLVDASERPQYQKALAICRASVAQGLLSEDDLKTRLGM